MGQTVEFKFSCGDLVRDRVAGLTGVVLAVSLYDTGCRHYGVCPRALDKDGKIPDWTFLDESRLELVEAAALVCPATTEGAPGRSGPAQNPPMNQA